MTEFNPFIFDPSHESYIGTRLLPCFPFQTSHDIGWSRVRVDRHRQPPWEAMEHSLSHHSIVIHHCQQPMQAERMLDGRTRNEQVIDGYVEITPAKVPQKAAWRQQIEFTLLFLDPAYVAQIAHESVDSDRIELVPHFATSDPLVHQIGLALKAELEAGESSSLLYVESAATMLAAHLLRHYSAQKHNLYKQGTLSRRRFQPVIDYMHSHLEQNLSLAELAAAIQMSTFYFARSFKQAFGVTPYQYLLQCRIEKAKQLLHWQDLSIAVISRQVGFHDQSSFTAKFRQIVGVTPKKYRAGL